MCAFIWCETSNSLTIKCRLWSFACQRPVAFIRLNLSIPWNLLCEFKIFNAMEICCLFLNLMPIICTLLIKYLATHHSIQNSTVIKYLLSKVSFFNIALHTEQYNDQQFAVVHCWKIKKLTLNWEAKRPSLGRTCSRASFTPHPAGPVRRGRSMGPAQAPHMQNHRPKLLKWVPGGDMSGLE